MDRTIKFFCIGHLPPLFKPAEPFTFVSPNTNQSLASLVIPDDSLGPTCDGKILSEYTQLFGLADHLMITKERHKLYLFQYRKFVSLSPGAIKASNMSYAYASDANEALTIFPRYSDLSALMDFGLVGPAVRVKSLVHQYAVHHYVEDICAFCSALTYIKEFDPLRIARFINCPVIFPAPSLGLVDSEIFQDQMKTLRETWNIFAANYYQARSGYQRRVGGFLLERLHSFLMTEQLEKANYNAVRGYQIIISNESTIIPTT